MQSTAADPLVGQVLEGRYRVRQRLAAGGMSTVYTAVDERLDREVAIKVMTGALSADPAFVDRFAREARSAAKLSHVNAVAVYDQGADAGNVFLVMELVRGRTLRDLIRERRRLSPAEAVSLMEPVLAALAAAHRAGLVHRDVKPENILLSDEGVVKVADFGLARAIETNSMSTRTGLMMGTVAYSSPEQFRGQLVDTRSDVYSAGVVFFELLTGHPPYHGPDAMAVAYQHVHNDVPRPSSFLRGLPPPIDALVARATARDPNRRPADAGAFLAELHDLRRELRLPVTAVPPRPRRGPSPRPATRPGRPTPAVSPTAATRANASARTAPQPRAASHHTAVAPSIGAPAVSGRLDPVGPSTSLPSPPAPKRRRWLRTLVGAVVLLLVCAAIIVASWWWTSGRYSAVADVRSQPVETASAKLKDQGFKVIVDAAQPSETIPKGNILATDPTTGHRQVRGRSVHLIPSSGPTFYGVPPVAGQDKATAEKTLASLKQGGILITYADTPDDPATPDAAVAAGKVISTNPVATTQLRKGQPLTVNVSAGLIKNPVPDVTTKSEADAKTTLTGAGFTVTESQAFSDTVAAGLVISQSPAAPGAQPKFTAIALVISKGPDLVTLPTIASLTPLATAQAQLEALGLVVKVEKSFGGRNGLVVGMDPGAGTQVKRGSTVTLSVV